ncbi:MAG: hypothetical protein KBC73_06190 [Burkholderiaceae bacterium]|nr:hypothetical protein [Burkholderiaceae bacterium]
MPQIVTVGAPSRFVTAIAWLAMLLALSAPLSAQAAGAGAMTLGLSLALALGAVVVAWGLLRRLGWARRLFIALLAVASLPHLGSLWALQPALVAAWPTLLALAGLGGVAWRLSQPLIRQEFA